MTDSAERLAEGIRVLLRAFTVDETRFPAAEGRMKYNALDFQALHFISGRPGRKSADLAAFLGVAPTTAQSVVERLVGRGLIVRTASPASGRAVALTLTEKGRSIRAAILRQDAANCRAMIEALPKAERTRFVDAVARIADALAESECA